MLNLRRSFISLLLIAPLLACQSIQPQAQTKEKKTMYGLIAKITVQPGQRDALAAILLEATRAMPDNLSYLVANDAKDVDALWVTEVWDSAESHKASLGLAAVQQALAKGRPLIACFAQRIETHPLGGVGLTNGK